nr:DUF4190 domain-containing protein [uncultured Acetatifactor sp.]
MDNQQNGWNNQSGGNGQWDRWNSNASNSSYYNQPTHRPYGQTFSIAAAVCGLLSVTTSCTIVLSLPLGALGILFAILARRKGKKMNGTCTAGLVFSSAGLTFAVIMMIYSLVMLPVFMKDESFRNQINTMTERMYGIHFTDLMEEYYGYSFEE